MARKSRKGQIRAANSGQALSEQRQTAAPAEKTYATVGYARLSILETRDRKDSEALQNQKALIREYIQSQGDLTLLSIYEDNGETGTNFQRPGFETMMEAICDLKQKEYHANLGKYDHLGKSENILKGLVYCGDCGRPMVRYKQVVKGKKVSYHYMCPNYAAMLEQSGCAYKFLREDILLDALSQLIGKEIEQAVDTVRLARHLSAGKEGQITARAAELRRLNLDLERAETRKKTVMQDFLAGELSRDEYEQLKICCTGEAERLKNRILALREEQHRQSETLTGDNPWLKTFGGLRLPDRLTKELAHGLIQRITIYADDKLEVVFKYQDEREQLLTAINKEVVA